MKKIEKQIIPIMPGEFSPVLLNIIGTCNEDGTPNLSAVSWVSFNPGPPKSIILSTAHVYTMPTLNNILRTGEFTVNLCTVGMSDFVEDVCAYGDDIHNHGKLAYGHAWGEKTKTPILDVSPFVVECKVSQTHMLGNYHIFFAEIVCQHLDKNLAGNNLQESDSMHAWSADDPYYKWLENMDMNKLDPLLWLGHWYRLERL